MLVKTGAALFETTRRTSRNSSTGHRKWKNLVKATNLNSNSHVALRFIERTSTTLGPPMSRKAAALRAR